MCSYNVWLFIDNDRKEIKIPLLGVSSESDTVVPIKLNPTEMVLIHDKGHKLPTRNPQIRKILIFLQTQKYDPL